MIRKVLIAEDHASANISVQRTLEELSINHIDYVYYCDHALQKIQVSKQRNESYDLLISDLYFEVDDQIQEISGGISLIPAVKRVQPDLKVLVFSAEDRASIVQKLYNELEIDGYVRKARHDIRELKTAIETIGRNECYRPRHLMHLLKGQNMHDFTRFDIAIISLMAQGIRQKELPTHLRKLEFRASGLSSVEKRLKLIKEAFDFYNNEQLVAYCKENGIV